MKVLWAAFLWLRFGFGKYAHIFCMKVLWAAFLWLRFGFGKRISAKKELSYKKHMRKMLMKLTTGVNFININVQIFRTNVIFLRTCI